MDKEKFAKLLEEDIDKAIVMYEAMVVRNFMEEFHVKHLTDKQMKELNPIIRQALFFARKNWVGYGQRKHKVVNEFVNNTVWSIPDYWEIPDWTDKNREEAESVGLNLDW